MLLRALLPFAFVLASASALASKPATPDATLSGAHGERIAIATDAEHVYLDAGATHLVGTTASGMRYFKRDSGVPVAEIKTEDKGFKVRDKDARLLWKVKITDDKIKVADNEEMKHAWSIKFKKGENAKVLDADEKEVGSVKLKSDSGKVKIKDASDQQLYVVESGRGAVAYGALLLTDVPEELRYVILAQLLHSDTDGTGARVRLVYYAVGGGLGHLVRARAFLRAIGHASRATVVTASEFACDARVVDGFDPLFVPRELDHDAVAFRGWLVDRLRELAPDCVCVDTFPAGILGELGGLPDGLVARWRHVARLLRWDEYSKVIRAPPPRYERVFRVEPLGADQQAYLDRHAMACEDIALVDDATPPVATDEPYWLVVHSGPREEVAELLAYADELRCAERAEVALWLATQAAPDERPPMTRVLDVFPATAYFASARRIVSAAGFNVMRQTAAFRHKQHIVPMPRRFDDQFERARRARATG